MSRRAERRTQFLALAVFFLIAFGVPWIFWVELRRTMPLDRMSDSFSTLWFTGAPSVAGFVAAFVEGGPSALKQFVRRVFSLRFNWPLWWTALLLPLVAALLTFLAHPVDLARGGAPKLFALFGLVSLMNLFTGPVAEEFGWRGYLLGTLCRRWRPLFAGLLIGPIWAAWHIPLFYDSIFAHLSSAIGYVAWTTAWSVVLCLIVARARGSVLPSVLGHWAINAAPGVFFALLPGLPGERQPGGLGFVVASLVVASIVAVVWRNTHWRPVS